MVICQRRACGLVFVILSLTRTVIGDLVRLCVNNCARSAGIAPSSFTLPRASQQKLSMSVAERAHRVAAGLWAAPTKNTVTGHRPYASSSTSGWKNSVSTLPCSIRLLVGHPRFQTLNCGELRVDLNTFSADFFRPFADRGRRSDSDYRREAIEELEYVTKQLGLKVVMLWSMIRGPFRLWPIHSRTQRNAPYGLTLGPDSEYD
jgi:hypothetical protein